MPGDGRAAGVDDDHRPLSGGRRRGGHPALPQCNQLHRFEAKDAIVLMDGAAKPAAVAGALTEG